MMLAVKMMAVKMIVMMVVVMLVMMMTLFRSEGDENTEEAAMIKDREFQTTLQ